LAPVVTLTGMEAERRRPDVRPLYMIGALLALAALGAVGWAVELPYVAFGPGPVADAARSVVAEGVETHPPHGELLTVTVVSQDVNIFEALIAGFDPTIDLVEKRRVRSEDETDEQHRNRVLWQMDDSNHRSIVVALAHLDIEMVPKEVVINEIVPGVPAESVLKPGDGIVAVNDVPVKRVAEIRSLTEGLSVGDTLGITVRRDGATRDVEVRLAEREDEPGAAMIGVVLGELTAPPFPLDIRAGDVGGPSAGMIHALAVIDTLTEGELTGGHVIAGTGTIGVDGSVGRIGGIRQKVVSAEAAGASHILVPTDNYEIALTAERESIEIVPVAHLEDALEFLETLEAA